MRKIYIASFRYGEAKLAEVELVRETPKFYIIDNIHIRDIIGMHYYVPRRVSKSKYNCFLTETEALYWLEGAMEKYINSLHQQVANSQNVLADIAKRVELLDE